MGKNPESQQEEDVSLFAFATRADKGFGLPDAFFVIHTDAGKIERIDASDIHHILPFETAETPKERATPAIELYTDEDIREMLLKSRAPLFHSKEEVIRFASGIGNLTEIASMEARLGAASLYKDTKEKTVRHADVVRFLQQCADDTMLAVDALLLGAELKQG